MEKEIRRVSTIFLTALYCFATGAVITSYFYSDFQHYPATSQDKVIVAHPATLFCHTAVSESPIFHFNLIPVYKNKKPFKNYWILLKGTEQLFESEYSQYVNFSKNIPRNHRKSDIIFPFHYFW